jgi:hypothetical protein
LLNRGRWRWGRGLAATIGSERVGAVIDLESVVVAIAVGVRIVRIRAIDIGFVVVEESVTVAV